MSERRAPAVDPAVKTVAPSRSGAAARQAHAHSGGRKSPLLLRLQATHGNHYVGELLRRTAATGGPVVKHSAASPVVQRLSWDDVSDAVSSVGSTVTQGVEAVGSAIGAGAQAVGDAVASGASAVGHAIQDGAQAVAGGAQAVGQKAVSGAAAAATAVSKAGHAVGSAVGGAVDVMSTDPAKTKANLLARLASVRTRLQGADPGSVSASTSQIAAINAQVSKFNVVASAAAIPLVVPLVAPAEGATAGGILAGLGELVAGVTAAVAALTVGEILLILAAIVLLLLVLVEAVSDTGRKVDDKGKEKDKSKEDDETKDKEKDRDKTKEKEKEDEEDDDGPRKPLFWNFGVVTEKSQPGALEMRFNAYDFSYHAHHAWPEYAGGLSTQPLMAVQGSAHNSLLHPTLDAVLKLGFAKDGLTGKTGANGPFIAKLRTDRGLRRQMLFTLNAFYAGFSVTNCDPGIPPPIYLTGIGASFLALGGDNPP